MNAGRSRLQRRCRGESHNRERRRGGRSIEGGDRRGTGVEGSEGTEAGGIETRRADTEWKESTERGRLLCAQTIPVRSCVSSLGEEAGRGKDEKGDIVRQKETPGELKRKEELKDETEKDGVQRTERYRANERERERERDKERSKASVQRQCATSNHRLSRFPPPARPTTTVTQHRSTTDSSFPPILSPALAQ